MVLEICDKRSRSVATLLDMRFIDSARRSMALRSFSFINVSSSWPLTSRKVLRAGERGREGVDLVVGGK